MLDHGDLAVGGCGVERSVASLVLATYLSPLAHQQTHHIQVTCLSQEPTLTIMTIQVTGTSMLKCSVLTDCSHVLLRLEASQQYANHFEMYFNY